MRTQELECIVAPTKSHKSDILWILYQDIDHHKEDCLLFASYMNASTSESFSFPKFIEDTIRKSTEQVIAAIVVMPLTLKPEEILLHPVIDGTSVGIYYYQTIEEARNYIEQSENSAIAKTGNRAVLSMWKDPFLDVGEGFYQSMRRGEKKDHQNAYKWFSDEVSRDDLVAKLSTTSLDLVMYVGHGRSRGWSGYRGVRWHHIEATALPLKPIGALVALTCDNLKFEKDRVPFGVQWIMSGRAQAFLGAICEVRIEPMIRLCSLIEDLLEENILGTIGDLMIALNFQISEIEDVEMSHCWQAFRLIGDPRAFI